MCCPGAVQWGACTLHQGIHARPVGSGPTSGPEPQVPGRFRQVAVTWLYTCGNSCESWTQNARAVLAKHVRSAQVMWLVVGSTATFRLLLLVALAMWLNSLKDQNTWYVTQSAGYHRSAQVTWLVVGSTATFRLLLPVALAIWLKDQNIWYVTQSAGYHRSAQVTWLVVGSATTFRLLLPVATFRLLPTCGTGHVTQSPEHLVCYSVTWVPQKLTSHVTRGR
jgi:hypothetical protein